MNLVQETASYIDGLMEDLQWTAEWRREKAEQFPDDDRNLKAAVLLEELAKQIGDLSGGELDRQLVSLWEACEASGDTGNLSEEKSQLLREVGFYWWGDAPDLVRVLISRFSRFTK
jgi:hypothetical protein